MSERFDKSKKDVLTKFNNEHISSDPYLHMVNYKGQYEEIKRENQELLECIEWIASHSVPRHYIMCDAYIIVKDHARRYMERLGKEFL